MKLSHIIGRVSAVVAAGCLTTALLVPGMAARADTAPPTAGTPVTVSTDVLPTVQIGQGVVWKQLVVGDTVYVGGEFSTARPAGAALGSQEVARSNFLAYNIKTGALLPFAPAFDGPVRSLAVSPDQQTLYVGGLYDKIDGVNRYRIAAFDIGGDQKLKTSFSVGTNAGVYGIAATATKVYLVGNFTSINSSTRTNVAAVSATTGAVLPFTVTPAGGPPQQVVVSPDGTKVAIGGSFTTMNGSGSPGYGLALVNSDSGALLPLATNTVIRNAGTNSAITSLAVSGDFFYGTGYRFGNGTGNLEGAFKAKWDGTLVWVGDCHGDSYSVAPADPAVSAAVYIAGHPHDCSDIGSFPDTKDPVVYHRAIAYTAATTGTVTKAVADYGDFRGKPAPSVLNWFPDFNNGTYTGQSQGPWSVAVGGDYVVYGGEFTKINGASQQGLVRFARPSVAPNDDGPVVTGSAFGLTGSASRFSGITVSARSNWDRDNIELTYTVRRDGAVVSTSKSSSTFWNRPTLSYNDRSITSGRTYRYQVTATDPFGNSATSPAVSVTAR